MIQCASLWITLAIKGQFGFYFFLNTIYLSPICLCPMIPCASLWITLAIKGQSGFYFFKNTLYLSPICLCPMIPCASLWITLAIKGQFDNLFSNFVNCIMFNNLSTFCPLFHGSLCMSVDHSGHDKGTIWFSSLKIASYLLPICLCFMVPGASLWITLAMKKRLFCILFCKLHHIYQQFAFCPVVLDAFLWITLDMSV